MINTVINTMINTPASQGIAPTLALLLLAGCQSLPSSTPNTAKTIHPMTANMPKSDRQGRIAYVEEQGSGASKVSTLYTISPDGSDRQRIDQLSGYIYSPAWSADGTKLAYSKQAIQQNPKIYLYDRTDNKIRLIVDSAGSNLSASFAPDGQQLLYSSTIGGNADIYLRDLRTGTTTQLTTLPSTEVQPSYAADGRSFVYTSDKVRAGRPRLYRYNFAIRQTQPIATTGYAASAQLSTDGQRLAYLNGEEAAIMSLATGQVVNLANTGLDEPARLSPSGQYVIYPTRTSQVEGQSGGSLVIRPLAGGNSYAINSQTGGVLRTPVWGR